LGAVDGNKTRKSLSRRTPADILLVIGEGDTLKISFTLGQHHVIIKEKKQGRKRRPPISLSRSKLNHASLHLNYELRHFIPIERACIYKR
jgi:hypothetical protein